MKNSDAEICDIHPDVDFWLSLWARSDRPRPSDFAQLGFPDRSKPFIGGGESQRHADFDEDAWRATVERNCAVMETLIFDLPPAQSCAVCHTYVGSLWKFPRDNLFELLEKASAQLLIGMRARAVI